MSWEDLLRKGRVQWLPAERDEIEALRRVARRDLADAAIPELSNDARMGLAYDAARTAASMALRASGYRARPLRGHETTFDALLAIGAPLGRFADALQALRTQRNTLTYVTAGDTTDAEAQAALRLAVELMAQVEAWLSDQHPELGD